MEDLKELIEQLMEEGLSDEEILDTIQKLIDEGKLPPEALDETIALLKGKEEDAEKLFGVDFVKEGEDD